MGCISVLRRHLGAICWNSLAEVRVAAHSSNIHSWGVTICQMEFFHIFHKQRFLTKGKHTSIMKKWETIRHINYIRWGYPAHDACLMTGDLQYPTIPNLARKSPKQAAIANFKKLCDINPQFMLLCHKIRLPWAYRFGSCQSFQRRFHDVNASIMTQPISIELFWSKSTYRLGKFHIMGANFEAEREAHHITA